MTTRNGFVEAMELTLDRFRVVRRRRSVALVGYAVSVVTFSLFLGPWSEETGVMILWTFLNSESSYLGWRVFHNFHPLREYLAIALTTATIHLLALWFIVFRGKGPIFDFPIARWLFKLERYPRIVTRLQNQGLKGRFLSGLVPEIWWVGFVLQKEKPRRFGILAVILGNATKLTIWSFVCYLAVSSFWKWAVIGVAILLVVFLPSRLLERLLPNGNREP